MISFVKHGICHHGLNGGPFPGPYEACGELYSDQMIFKLTAAKNRFVSPGTQKVS